MFSSREYTKMTSSTFANCSSLKKAARRDVFCSAHGSQLDWERPRHTQDHTFHREAVNVLQRVLDEGKELGERGQR